TTIYPLTLHAALPISLGRRATRSSGWPVGAGGARRADERTRHGRERTRERRRAPRGRRGAARAARGGGPTAGAHRRRRARRRARSEEHTSELQSREKL